MWNPESGFQLITLDQDYFLAKFDALSDYETAKFGGPWMVLDHYLIAQEWRPNFNPRKNKTDSILAWVRFPSLPIEYFDDDFIKKIGKVIGRPVKIDYATNLVSKGKFARACIELDITKPLLSRFVLNSEEWPIEYQGIHQICFKCGIYGHRIEMCGKDQTGTTINGTPSGTAEAQPGLERPIQKPKEKYGAWMLVTRNNRRNQQKSQNQSNANTGRGRQNVVQPNGESLQENVATHSQFGALYDLEDPAGAQNQQERAILSPPQQPNLPRIRTNYRGTRQNVVLNEVVEPGPGRQPPPPRQPPPSGRGAYRDRGGRGF
ncbi:PREDICTED: uncharacterized protein LOC109166497 [Ipomoea nil]|uniref:uncharacterized protein LOC109166497 n=1 Tax=Ipomoea nil TaxID=35883 RepID=UPI000901DA12|nr:PREDICTED: uncharacterized protein LOC109166497 [Ipomoea nil]